VALRLDRGELPRALMATDATAGARDRLRGYTVARR